MQVIWTTGLLEMLITHKTKSDSIYMEGKPRAGCWVSPQREVGGDKEIVESWELMTGCKNTVLQLPPYTAQSFQSGALLIHKSICPPLKSQEYITACKVHACVDGTVLSPVNTSVLSSSVYTLYKSVLTNSKNVTLLMDFNYILS